MTKQYECLECKFECYNLSVAKKHLERTNHQVVPAGQKNIVKEVKEPTWLSFAKELDDMFNKPREVKEVKDPREDWEPGVSIRYGWFGDDFGYEVCYYTRRIGIYDTVEQALAAITDWSDHADTCETCSDGFPGAASHV